MEECLPSRSTSDTLRKSAFGRTNLFLKTSNAIFREIRCTGSTVARQASASIFHVHQGTRASKKPDDCVCWHCCHAYEGEGFRLPRIYDPSENVYHVYGWFCSANCAKAYILEHSTFDRGYQMNIFVRMLRDVYNIDTTVNEAPPRISLTMFGGPFDIRAFRQQTNVCLTITPPFVSYCMLIEERQPISNMGEQPSSGVAAQRGSVRGLRRPSQQPSMSRDGEEICQPDVEGLYASFMASHDSSADTSTEAPAPKRSRTSRSAKAVQGGGGLAKFAAVPK